MSKTWVHLDKEECFFVYKLFGSLEFFKDRMTVDIEGRELTPNALEICCLLIEQGVIETDDQNGIYHLVKPVLLTNLYVKGAQQEFERFELFKSSTINSEALIDMICAVGRVQTDLFAALEAIRRGESVGLYVREAMRTLTRLAAQDVKSLETTSKTDD